MAPKLLTFRSVSALVGAAALAASMAGCASKPAPLLARVDFKPTAEPQPVRNQPISGSIRLTQRGDEVVLRGQVEHLASSGAHALYIYEGSDCAALGPGAAHFNPTGAPHSFPGSGHAGDLPQLVPNAQGQATVHYVTKAIALSGPKSVIGKAVGIYRDPDQPAVQPDGGAGPRLACGVITLQPATAATK